MFERYTEKARRAVFFARYEASHFGAETIESEHLLLGMWREGSGVVNELMGLGDAWPGLRERIERRSPPRKFVSTSVDMPISEEVKRTFDYAAEEAERLGRTALDMEHLLLGLLREEGCFAAELLR